MSANGMTIDPAPNSLSLEEVRLLASEPSLFDGSPLSQHIAMRLCATVRHWRNQAASAVSIESATLEEWKLAEAAMETENVRLSALVAQQREALKSWEQWEADIIRDDRCWSGSVPTIEQEHLDALTPLQEARTRILADPTGQRAAEELRLLRAWEEAHRRKLDALDLSPYDRLVRGRAIEEAESQADRAWTALEEFREKTL
jgi:hypothetical protein